MIEFLSLMVLINSLEYLEQSPALNDDGEHCGGVTGFLLSTAATIRRLKPTRVIIVFDGKGGSK